MQRILDNSSEAIATTAFPVAGGSKTVDGRSRSISAQVTVTVNTPSNQTFASTAVNTSTSKVTITAHGFSTGLAVTMTTTGALPTGLSTSTTYYIIVVDVNTVQFATTLANAQAGTNISLTGQGSGNDTVNVTALATGTVQFQKSNDGTNWANDGSSVSITATGTYWLEDTAPAGKFMRVNYSLASGSFSASTVFCLKGDIN